MSANLPAIPTTFDAKETIALITFLQKVDSVLMFPLSQAETNLLDVINGIPDVRHAINKKIIDQYNATLAHITSEYDDPQDIEDEMNAQILFLSDSDLFWSQNYTFLNEIRFLEKTPHLIPGSIILLMPTLSEIVWELLTFSPYFDEEQDTTEEVLRMSLENAKDGRIVNF